MSIVTAINTGRIISAPAASLKQLKNLKKQTNAQNAQRDVPEVRHDMDIYLTDIETNDRLRFPMLPEKINVQTGTIFQSYSILSVGDISLPTGEELTSISWDGILPGERRLITPHQYIKEWPYIAEWQYPDDIQKLLDGWRTARKKLHLLVTETPINIDVFIQRYTVEYSGGYGDFTYSISLTQAKDLKVYASGASEQGDATAATAENQPQGQERPEPPPAATYTVVKGDTLWAIAQKEMGAGSKYPELHAANRDVIGSDPDKVQPGQVLTIPR